MKKLIVLFTMLSLNCYASESCVTSLLSSQVKETKEISKQTPKELEGATIVVTLKDGSKVTFSADQYKVVPRKQQFVVTKVENTNSKVCSSKNRLGVLAGYGAREGLDRDDSNSPDEVVVKSKVGAVVGAQYQRKTDLKISNMPLSVGVQVQSNKTVLGTLGLEF